VTEAEWLAAIDPQAMLAFLRTQRDVTDRKLRLCAAACCLRVGDWLGANSRRAVEMLERQVDGKATLDDLRRAATGASDDWLSEFGTHHPSNGAYVATDLNMTSADAAAGAAAEIAEAVRCEACVSKGISLQGWPPPPVPDFAVRRASQDAGEAAVAAERAAQCQILRDIFHGPCRAVYFRCAWRTDTVRSLASVIYDARAFDRLPLLADALVAVGCTDAELLGHLRGPGPHVRGCWALDLILAKS
jgi:hypothetical protein